MGVLLHSLPSPVYCKNPQWCCILEGENLEIEGFCSGQSSNSFRGLSGSECVNMFMGSYVRKFLDNGLGCTGPMGSYIGTRRWQKKKKRENIGNGLRPFVCVYVYTHGHGVMGGIRFQFVIRRP